MIEKRGVIDEQNTRPEVPTEQDLTQHPIKRASDKVMTQPTPDDDLRPFYDLSKLKRVPPEKQRRNR